MNEPPAPDRDSPYAPSAGPMVLNPARPPRYWPVAVIVAVAAVCYLTIYAWPEMQSGLPWVLTYGTTMLLLLSLAGWLLFFSRLAAKPKWSVFLAGLAFLFLLFGTVRVRGYKGDLAPVLGPGRLISWMWPTPGPKLWPGPPVDLQTKTATDVPEFLGPGRRPVYDIAGLETDWKAHPPKQLWRQPIGEGFSSYAVVGDYAVTQLQDGDNELVVCYEWRTGHARWKHVDDLYFTSSLGGAGPRATPTIDEGRVYALGATGLLNCLDGRTGKQLWQRDVRTENHAKNLEWGFSASPLIVGNLVVVSAGDKDTSIQQRKLPHYTLIAYDKHTGKPVWRGGTDNASYCSPALATICGVRQIVIANAGSVTGHDLADGHVLWEFPWQREMPTVSQVVPLGNDLVFVSKGYNAGCGVRQISRNADGKWSVADVWSKPTLMRTKFTNVVLRDGYAYGLNDGFLECIDVKKGARRWTTRSGHTADYEHGQVLLVGDLLLVQSEQGDVALVEATPKKFHEVTRFSAISGRTWNYPVLIGRYLLVRNDHEAACYELPVKE